MKKTWTCPKCQGTRIGYFEEVLERGHRGLTSRPVGAAVTGSILGAQVVEGVGTMEAFVCTDCGYFEEYVRDPQSVQWDQLRGFRRCQR